MEDYERFCMKCGWNDPDYGCNSPYGAEVYQCSRYMHYHPKEVETFNKAMEETMAESEDWYDVPADEMTLAQARQAVKDLRKKLAELLDQQSRQKSILNKIRAEILEEKNYAYADFDQYKVVYLGVDARYVEYDLPQDDFRYGMERALEIIDTYKAGKGVR